MILSDRDLMAAIGDGRLVLDPTLVDRVSADPDGPSPLQPASLDLLLGNTFRTFNSHLLTCIDPRVRQDDLTRVVEVAEGDPFVLHPGEFVLGVTVEQVTLDASLAARLEGKSSLGRLGLMVHSTAGFIDPGFCGRITLELSNVASLPILLWPGMRIAQLCVLQMSSAADRPYGTPWLGSRYQFQDGPVASRSWLGWSRTSPPL